MECVELPEELKCPVCLEFYGSQVIQCVSGHSICTTCLSKVSKCPQCRVSYSYGKIQNRSLEALIDSLTVPCLYKINGCSKKVQYIDLREHARNCPFGNMVSLCKDMGFDDCTFKINPSNVSEAKDHLIKDHNALLISSRNNSSEAYADIYFRGVNDLADAGHCIWKPLLFQGDQQRDGKGSLILVLCTYNGMDQTIAWKGLHLGDNLKLAANYFVDIEMKSDSVKVGELKWRMGTVSILSDKTFIETPLFKLDHDFLLENFIISKHKYSLEDEFETGYNPRICDGVLLRISVGTIGNDRKVLENGTNFGEDNILFVKFEKYSTGKPYCLMNQGKGLNEEEIKLIRKLAKVNSISLFKLGATMVWDSFKIVLQILLTLLLITVFLCIWLRKHDDLDYEPVQCVCNNIHELIIGCSNWLLFHYRHLDGINSTYLNFNYSNIISTIIC